MDNSSLYLNIMRGDTREAERWVFLNWLSLVVILILLGEEPPQVSI